MSNIQRVSLPKDANNIAIQLTPAATALSRTVNSSLSASVDITLQTNTTFIRVYAISQDIYLKWGTTAVTSSNFDEIIPVGQVVDFLVPTNSSGVKYTDVCLIERTASATVVFIEK